MQGAERPTAKNLLAMLEGNGISMLVTRAVTRPLPRGLSRAERNELADVLAEGAVEAGFQPIVELCSGRTIGWEALARGPRGSSLERPDHLFGAARAAGRLEELDWLCQRQALRAALDAGVRAPCVLFLNIEPDTSGFLPLELRNLYARAVAQMTVCVEVTERALTQRPGALLGHIADMRAMGVAVALDDVGTDSDTLAMMSLLAPEVIKLDLALVQGSPDAEVAEVVHAVAAQAERSGARILVEGVETPEQALAGDALGASLAQGFLYGRRNPMLELPQSLEADVVCPGRHADPRDVAPFELVATRRPPRPATRALLTAMTQHLEDQARALGRTAVLVASFERDQRYTAALRDRYTQLGSALAFCAIVGRGVPLEPAPGVHGGAVVPGDPVGGEWTVAVIAPHYAAALVAHERADTGADGEHLFDYVLTYDRELATSVAASLTARVAN